MTKGLSLEDIARLGDLLAAIPEPFVPMEADMLDGYLTAIALMRHPPETNDWIAYVYDEEGRDRARLPNEERQAELRKLILMRGAELEEAIINEKEIDPIIYEDEDEEGEEDVSEGSELEPLSAFSDGFAFACANWPELMKNDNKAVQAALIGILRYESKDESAAESEEDEVLEDIQEETPFVNLDEALADLVSCVQEIAEVTRAMEIERAAKNRTQRRKPPMRRR